MALLEDDMTSRKGLCLVSYVPPTALETISMADVKDIFVRSGEQLRSLPLRMTSYHYCNDDNLFMKAFMNATVNGFGNYVGLRLRPHFGSPLEMQYSLLSFGIHCQGFLEADSGNSSHGGNSRLQEQGQKYLNERRRIEKEREEQRIAEENATGIILYPNPNDVLIGRGSPYQEYSGNRRHHQLVDSMLDKYNESNDRLWKTCVAGDVVKRIQESNGRFLTRTTGGDRSSTNSENGTGGFEEGWKVIDDVIARDKTSIAFRSRKAYKIKKSAIQDK